MAYKLDVKYAQFKKLDVVDQIKKLKPAYMKVADKLEDMEFSETFDDGFEDFDSSVLEKIDAKVVQNVDVKIVKSEYCILIK